MPPGQPVHSIMDPENEDSDVSSSEADLRGFERPVGLPPAPSKQALENQQTISDRLSELESIENRNIQRHDLLKEKRARMDGRIARHRAAQDAKIRAIMDARARRDTLIMQRRSREDISFQRFYEELEDEETVSSILSIFCTLLTLTSACATVSKE